MLTATAVVGPALLAAAGVVLGLLTRRELTNFGYRVEGDEPRGDGWAGWVSWWPVLALAVLWPAVAVTVGARYGGEAVPAYLLLGWVSVVLVWIDADVHRLPNGLTYPAYPALAVLLAAASVARGDGRWVGALVGMIALLVVFTLLFILSRGQLGLGDVKWSGVIGLALGWLGFDAVVTGTMATFLTGGVWALVLLVSRRATGATMLAYGPAMCVGAFIAVLSGARVVDVLG